MDTQTAAIIGGLGSGVMITGVVEILKPFLPEHDTPRAKRWWPVTALLLGVVLNVAAALILRTDPTVGLGVGISAGVIAAGFYSINKTRTE